MYVYRLFEVRSEEILIGFKFHKVNRSQRLLRRKSLQKKLTRLSESESASHSD